MHDLININDTEINVVSHDETFLISNKEVALAFGVGEPNIRKHKSTGEYIEGVHFTHTLVDTAGGSQKATMWTKRGIIRLGFKLRETEKTIAFRDWAEDYIMNSQSTTLVLPQTYLEALKSLTEEVEKKERAIAIIHKQEKSIEEKSRTIHNVWRSRNSYTATEVAKDLDHPIAAQLMNKILFEAGIIYSVGNTWALYTRYTGYELGTTKEVLDNNGKTRMQFMWSAKGKDWLIKNFGTALDRCSKPTIKQWKKYISSSLPKIPKKKGKKEGKTNKGDTV